LVFFTLHGSLFLTIKTEKEHKQRISTFIPKLWISFVSLYAITTLVTFFVSPYLFEGVLKNPIFWILLVLLAGSIIYIPVAAKAEKYFKAFVASSLTIASMVGLTAVSLFPRLVPSNIDLAYSLTVYNASSTQYTLKIMLIIALVGMPFVIGYTAFIYRVFKGKVVLTKDSY
jgi:cytochrome bd ubiquinol oxidase subunit II